MESKADEKEEEGEFGQAEINRICFKLIKGQERIHHCLITVALGKDKEQWKRERTRKDSTQKTKGRTVFPKTLTFKTLLHIPGVR